MKKEFENVNKNEKRKKTIPKDSAIASTCLQIINNSFKLLETIKKEEEVLQNTETITKRVFFF